MLESPDDKSLQVSARISFQHFTKRLWFHQEPLGGWSQKRKVLNTHTHLINVVGLPIFCESAIYFRVVTFFGQTSLCFDVKFQSIICFSSIIFIFLMINRSDPVSNQQSRAPRVYFLIVTKFLMFDLVERVTPTWGTRAKEGFWVGEKGFEKSQWAQGHLV